MSKTLDMNWIDTLTNKNKPVGFKKVIKGNKPEWADSYVYKISSKELNKTYIGYHKENGKVYFNSTTDEELIKLLSDSNANLVFEIVKFGSKLEMIQLEHELLTKVDAKNNSDYWNKTNGQSGVKDLNRKAIDVILDIVNNGGGEYLKEATAVVDLSDIPKAQVRDLEYDKDNLNDIIDAINRSGGSTVNAKPPVVLENREYDGVFYKELRIGGAHTIQAYMKTKYKDTTSLTPIVITEELHKNIPDDGITLLGDLLNSKKEISSPAKPEDGKKFLLSAYNCGRAWKSPDIKQHLFDMGLSTSSVKTAYDMTQAAIDNQEAEEAGSVVMDYTDKHEYILEEYLEEVREFTTDAFVGSSASGNVIWDRIVDTYDKNKTDEHKRVIWVVYHTSKKRRDELWPKLKKKLENLIMKYSKVNIEFREMLLYTTEVDKG